MRDIESLDIIIPTYNNPDILAQCLSSILAARLSYPINPIIVNNGHPNSLDTIKDPSIKIVQAGKNLGWEGGLKEGLKHSHGEFVCFMNDDVFVPAAQNRWLQMLMSTFRNPEVGAVGPSSNVVMGPQNIWKAISHLQIETTYLIGFCIIFRRKALDESGGVDDTLPGGDDLDLSIRLREKGWKLVARRDVFVYHHGFVTGTKLHGGSERKGGWNSREMTERTDMALMKKHGFRKWFECRAGLEYPGLRKGQDHEGDVVREWIIGDKIVDLGCANNKTVSSAVGVDFVPRGKAIPNLNAVSEADVTADIENKLPFDQDSQDTVVARHVLEHCMDTVATIKNWASILRPGGRLIIAVPDEDAMPSINLNPEHIHAFNESSLKTLAEVCGLKALAFKHTAGLSVVAVLEK